MRRRRTSRRGYSRPLKTIKYSNETTSFAENVTFPNGNDQFNAVIVSAVNSQGMRKAKNFTIKLTCATNAPIVWALVYVPQGQNPSTMGVGSSTNPVSLYEPNQNVIMAGTLPVTMTPSGGTGTTTSFSPQISRTRLARNLNSGDSIYLVCRGLWDAEFVAQMTVMVNYAITY